MIGEKEHDRKVFLAQNLDKIRIDCAKGGGEYLIAYAQMKNCSPEGSLDLAKMYKINFERIFSHSPDPDDIDKIYSEMEAVVGENSSINQKCGATKSS